MSSSFLSTKTKMSNERFLAMSQFEVRLKEKGYSAIAGVDEVGRGPLAGPLVAAACILPSDFFCPQLNDSKKLCPKRREIVYQALLSHPGVVYGIGIVDSVRIDEINIFQATLEAMSLALEALSVVPDYVLVDGKYLPKGPSPAEAIIRGDGLSISIAAASNLAKVTRDRLMVQEAHKWPEYGFEMHKGYPTQKHREALKKHGICPLHRKSFALFQENPNS